MNPFVRACLHPLACGLLGAVLALPAVAQPDNPNCPLRIEHYGPFDYRTEQDKLAVVHKYHFTPRVESLIRGEGSYLGDDISYTLKASPNHHRALVSLVRFWERSKVDPPPNVSFTVDCFFFRGIRFKPDDHIVRMLYAQYLGKRGRQEEAARNLEAALQYAGDNPLTHYNIGLLYFDLRMFDKALVQAHMAKKLGFPRPDLEESLRKQGAWRDPE
jgi:hypothetical protein